MIHHDDCLAAMAAMGPESVDAIVTDPPYGLEFMGKEWDKFRTDDPGTARNRGERAGMHGAKGSTDERWGEGARTMPSRRLSYGAGDRPTTSRCTGCGKRDQRRNPHDCVLGAVWKSELIDPYSAPPSMLALQNWTHQWATAAYRVAKPSAYLLAFGGTRTVHRMTVALEDAGWIIRDMLVWAYASGFPKSKASLKPAWEPIVMARKPGPLRMLAIDECRIGFVSDADRSEATDKNQHSGYANPGSGRDSYSGNMPPRTDYDAPGRWPANVILTDPIFDGGIEGVVGGGEAASGIAVTRNGGGRLIGGHGIYGGSQPHDGVPDSGYGDSGTYSRFFLVPKSSRSDREPVLGGLPLREATEAHGYTTLSDPRMDRVQERKARANVHPTVKPTDLMRHLIRLVTPTGGTVLDPFLGSGSTALAAEMEGFAWIGIEREAEYVAIAEARLNGTQRGLGLGA